MLCGSMPTPNEMQFCKSQDQWTSKLCSINTFSMNEKSKSTKRILVLDKACNGCARLLHQQNIWHIMTRLHTAWRVMKYSGNASHMYDLHFTVRPPHGNISNAIWTGLSKGNVVMKPNWNDYSAVIRMEDITAKLSEWIHASSTLADRLWSIGFRSQQCKNSLATVPWRQFIFDIRASQNVLSTRGSTKSCMFLRRPLNNDNTSAVNKRTEANIYNLLQSVNIHPVHFSIHESFKSHIQKASLCHTAIGLHGAQMVNMIWMGAGGSIIEFDSVKHFFYQNMAHLTGHDYTRMSICPACIAQPTPTGIHFDVAKFKAMYRRLNVAKLEGVLAEYK